MDSIDITSLLGTAGAGSPFITLFILWKLGLLRKNGNGKVDEILQKHEERLDIANQEMGNIKISIAKIEVNIESIKESQERQEKTIDGIYKQLNK